MLCVRKGISLPPSQPRQAYAHRRFLMSIRERVAFNFSPKNSSQAAGAMKTGHGVMIGFCCGEENNSSRRVILFSNP